MNWKWKLKLVVVIILILALSYFYYWYTETMKLRAEADKVLQDSERLMEVNNAINEEFFRCQTFITQSEGEFGSFEYCKRFIEWVDENGLRE